VDVHERRHRLAVPVEQAELELRIGVDAVALVEVQVDGYIQPAFLTPRPSGKQWMDQRHPPRVKAQDMKESPLMRRLIREYPFMVSTCDPATDSATMADALVGGGTGTGGKEVGVLMELEHQPATVARRRRSMENERL